MDKYNRILAATEDNSAAIAALKRSCTQKTCNAVIDGIKNGGTTDFGKVRSSGNSVAVARFDGGGSLHLVFNGVAAVYGPSPLMAEIPVGDNEISLSEARDNAQLLLIGVDVT